jgi:hypothetical protein
MFSCLLNCAASEAIQSILISLDTTSIKTIIFIEIGMK